MEAPSGNGVRFVVEPTYDRQWGYPAYVYHGPDRNSVGRIFDADVSMLIRVTPSPAVRLEPVAAGEAYSMPTRGRIVRTDVAYYTLLGFLFKDIDDRIRLLWPQQAATILERGNTMYWDKVEWIPQQGMVGTILGTFKHPSGKSLYLMELRHRGDVLYFPIAAEGVVLINEP